MKEKTKTVGQMAVEAALKKQDPMLVRDQTTLMHQEYGDKLFDTVAKGKQEYPEEPVFFIEDITRQERLLMNVLRHTLFPRISCPTPNYDQTVYRYKKKDDTLELVWTVPSPETCAYYLHNSLMVAPEERELLNFILDFKEGRLELLARRLNNEECQFNMALVKEEEE